MLDSNQPHAPGIGPGVESQHPQESSSHGVGKGDASRSGQLPPEARQHQIGAEAVNATSSCLADR